MMSEYNPITHLLTRNELQRYEHDPNWKNARRIIFISFWILLFLMLVSAVVIIRKSENYMCRAIKG